MIVARVIVPFLITSLSANAGIIGDGLAKPPILLVPSMDRANSPMSESDATPPLESETISDRGWWTPRHQQIVGRRPLVQFGGRRFRRHTPTVGTLGRDGRTEHHLVFRCQWR